MKKLIVVASIFLAFAALSGCTSMNKSVPSMPLSGSAPVVVAPDVEVGEKINGTASIQKILFFQLGEKEYADGVTYRVSNSQLGNLGLVSLADQAKAAAALKAVNDSGADLIVAPRYEIRSLGIPFLYQEISATVTGYKGTIKGFRQVKN